MSASSDDSEIISVFVLLLLRSISKQFSKLTVFTWLWKNSIDGRILRSDVFQLSLDILQHNYSEKTIVNKVDDVLPSMESIICKENWSTEVKSQLCHESYRKITQNNIEAQLRSLDDKRLKSFGANLAGNMQDMFHMVRKAVDEERVDESERSSDNDDHHDDEDHVVPATQYDARSMEDDEDMGMYHSNQEASSSTSEKVNVRRRHHKVDESYEGKRSRK